MIDTWLSWCVRQPGPKWKQSYSNYPSRQLGQIMGLVLHSAGGSISSTFNELEKPFRQASWTCSVAKSGASYQHYPLEAITWHCGKRGSWNNPGNVTLWGIEFEGGPPSNVSEPLTIEQESTSVSIIVEAYKLSYLFKSNPPLTRVNLFEHKWISATACPSGRFNWPKLISLAETQLGLSKPAPDEGLLDRVILLEQQMGKLIRWQATKL